MLSQFETAADTSRGKRKHISVTREGAPRGDADILLHFTCILLIMTFPIVQMVSCLEPPQNTGPRQLPALPAPCYASEYELAREGEKDQEKDEEKYVFLFFRIMSSSVERDEFSVVA